MNSMIWLIVAMGALAVLPVSMLCLLVEAQSKNDYKTALYIYRLTNAYLGIGVLIFGAVNLNVESEVNFVSSAILMAYSVSVLLAINILLKAPIKRIKENAEGLS